MFNHGRTLLLNLTGAMSPGPDFLAEELVPPEYRPVTTIGYMDTVRAVLFGSDPDRAMLNYRIRQYLQILHSTELAGYLFQLDPRITYEPNGDSTLVTDDAFQFTAVQTSGPLAQFSFSGSPAIPDVSGHVQFSYSVTPNEDTVIVQRRKPSPSQSIVDLALTNGLTNTVSLPGSGYSFALNTVDPGVNFLVSGYLRPQWDLGQIVALLQQIGETVMLSLLGDDQTEPYYTFSNLFYQNAELPYQLGAVLMALIYRMEDRRHGLG